MRPAEDTDEVWVDDGFGSVAGPFEWRDGEELVYHWNPRDDDGDAFRLAVRLRMLVDVPSDDEFRQTVSVVAPNIHAVKQPLGDDHCAAVRRAILRAAAAIGSKS